MEKVIIKIGRFIETATASLVMLGGVVIAQQIPFVGVVMMIVGILLFNELIREEKEKEGGAR